MSFAPTKPREYGSTKELVARLIDEAGGVKRAAFLGGRAASQVYAYADHAVDAQMSLDMARRENEREAEEAEAAHVAENERRLHSGISELADDGDASGSYKLQ